MYKIIRTFMQHPSEVTATGLTLEEAQEHCKDTETSSLSATSKEATAITKRMGPWFDGYEKE